MAATPQIAGLLPNGMQQFLDQNGQPYANGKVFFYVPGTTTLKTTWLDPAETVQNSNPVNLDGAGRAVIYGVGQYRQVLFDQFGGLVWDQLTAGSTALNTNPVTVNAGSTTDLGATGSNKVVIQGAGSINSFGSSASTSNSLYFLVFNSTVTLVNSGNLILPGGANATLLAGTFALAEYEGAGVWQVFIIADSGGRVLSWSGPDKAIASAATTDIGSLNTNMVTVTGATQITSLGASATTANPLYFVKFTGILQLVQNPVSLQLPGGASITTAAGNSMLAEYLGGGNWQVLAFWGGTGGGGTGGVSVLADTNNSSVVFASNTSLTVAWTEVVAKTTIGGTAYLGTNFSSNLNFGSTGANGLDTGAIAASTFYAVYAIYNPSSNTWASLASLNQAYAPTLPAGYTAMALLAVVPTNGSSQIVAGFTAFGNKCWFQPVQILNGHNSVGSLTQQSVAAAVPPGARSCSGVIGGTVTAPNTINTYAVSGDSSNTGIDITSPGGSGSTPLGLGLASQSVFVDVPLITSQNIWWFGTGTTSLYITGYTIGGATTSGGGGGGGGGGLVLIQKQVGSGTVSLTFAVASATYNEVELHFNDVALLGPGAQFLELQFNGDVAGHYLWAWSAFDAAGASSSGNSTSSSAIQLSPQLPAGPATFGGIVKITGTRTPGVSNPPFTGVKVETMLTCPNGLGQPTIVRGAGSYTIDGPITSVTVFSSGASGMDGQVSLWGWAGL